MQKKLKNFFVFRLGHFRSKTFFMMTHILIEFYVFGGNY